jgi:hypothetical protein
MGAEKRSGLAGNPDYRKESPWYRYYTRKTLLDGKVMLLEEEILYLTIRNNNNNNNNNNIL